MTASNSPLLFGCRTGVCGTCLLEVLAVSDGSIAPAEADEQELLDILAKDHPGARLACRIRLTANLTVRRITA